MKRHFRAGLSVLLSWLLLTAFFSSAQAAEPDFQIVSKAAPLMAPEDDTLLFSKNAEQALPIASVSKVMTAILVLETVKDPADTWVRIDARAVSGFEALGASTAGFQYHVGERFTVLDLLYGMLVPSGCEAAEMLAWYLSDGDVDAFARQMTARAKALGCEHSYYAEPHGLTNRNYSSCSDLYLQAKHALTLPYFREIIKTRRYLISGFDQAVYTTNDLLDPENETYYCAGTLGIKTGYTETAGRCLLSYCERGGQTLICVTLGAAQKASDGNLNHAMLDSKALLDWGLSALETGALVTNTQKRRLFFFRVLGLFLQFFGRMRCIFAW